jgi:hypothetical protein
MRYNRHIKQGKTNTKSTKGESNMTKENLIALLEKRVAAYEGLAPLIGVQGFEIDAVVASALADELKQILSYLKE